MFTAFARCVVYSVMPGSAKPFECESPRSSGAFAFASPFHRASGSS